MFSNNEGDESILIVGGAGDNNIRYNDLWQYSNHKWTLLTPENSPDDAELPSERGGH